MKKVLSLVLVLCMLLSTCVLFASCSKVNEKKFEENPQEALNNAIDKAADEFFATNDKAAEIIEAAMQKGAITLNFESEDLKNEVGIGKIVLTQYVNAENKKLAYDISANFMDQDLSAKIFGDKNGIIVSGADIFGTDKAYGVYPSTFAEKFFTSAWATMLELDEEAVPASVKEMIPQFVDLYKKAFETTPEQAAQNANALLAALGQSTAEEKLEIDGKNVNCVVVTYKINKDTLTAFIKKSNEINGLTGEQYATVADEMIASLEENLKLDLTMKMCVEKKSGAMAMIKVDGKVTVINSYTDFEFVNGEYVEKKVTNETTVDVTGEYTFGEDAIEMTMKGTAEGETVVLSAKIEKEVDGKETTFKATASSKFGEEKMDFGSITYTTNSKTGDFSVKVKPNADMVGTDMEITLKGNVAVEKNKVTIKIDSVKAGETTVSFKTLSIVFDSSKDVPAAPAATDAVTMTMEDITAFVEAFQNSKLGKLLMGS